MSQLILVDQNDTEVGTISKLNAHLGDAKRHRAITAFLVNDKKQFLLTKRSLKKPLWPTYWDAAFSTHPNIGETVQECCERRSQEELGIKTKSYKDHFSYEYSIKWSEIFSEWEINHILVSNFDGKITPNTEEVSIYRWLSWKDLNNFCFDKKNLISPWLQIALKKITSAPILERQFT